MSAIWELALGILNNNSIYLLHGHIVVRLIKISEELQQVSLGLAVKGGRRIYVFIFKNCIVKRLILSTNNIPSISRHEN